MKLKLEIKIKDVIKYSIEALIVTFGVILGLVLTQNISQKKTDRNTKSALIQITEELDNNILKFEKAGKYHVKMAIQIDSAFHTIKPEDLEKKYYSYEKFKYYKLNGWFGIQTVDYEDVMFESAKINGVFQELNIETLKTISQAYSQMHNYGDFKKTFWDKFLSIDSKTTVMDIFALLNTMKGDMINFEGKTLKIIKDAKIELEKTTHKNAYKK